jgi:CheY-like chemotaxis protein
MKTILLVDDEADFLDGLSSLLTDAGYQVRTAGGALEGIDSIKKKCPDLVLLDLMMPGKRGIETAQYMKKNANFCKIPIILMSASKEAKSEKIWDAFLAKPFDIDEVLGLVSSYIGPPT